MSKTFSRKLEELVHFCRERKEINWGDFLEQLGVSGAALVSLTISIPFLFLAFIPGLMMALGALIFLAGVCIALNKQLWMPAVLRRRRLSGDKMANRLIKWVKFLKKIETTIHPRGKLYKRSLFLQTFTGFLISLCGLFLFLSLSPFANFLPALGVFLLSVGILEEDLWVIIGGYAVLLIKILKLFIPIFM